MNYIIIILSLFFSNLLAQVYINELMSSNTSTLYDSSGDTPDWIEIYNASQNSINLGGYGLSDDLDEPFKWTFPGRSIDPYSYLLVYASGQEETVNVQHWETVIDWGDEWKYFVGNTSPPSDWMQVNMNDSDWLTGESGFGYGDNDDNTIVGPTVSIYVRKTFYVESLDDILNILLHVDYDDAFVAYINGIEVARSNIGSPGLVPNYNQGANSWHEATIFSGGMPEEFHVNLESILLEEGDNLLAIQVHNYDINSSDLSLIPFLTLGMASEPDNAYGAADILNLQVSNLHANFKISSSGETILLTSPSNETIDLIDPLSIPADISFGRFPDGGENWLFFPESTPGNSNNTDGFDVFCDAPSFSHEGGLYDSSLEISITSSLDNYPIYYTLDGSDPTYTSNLYNQSINIDETTVIRASILHPDCFANNITTHSFLINEDINLPVVSLSTNPENFWDDETGIYALGNNAESDFPYFGANFWQDWERPIHIEFFESDGSLGFSQDAGVKIFGGWSRGLAQKSLSIFARSEYGSNEINYKIFEEKDLESFKAIVLRNSGNDWYGEGQGASVMFRDGMQTGLMNHTGVDHQAYKPSVVFINGEYWGIHNIREKVNEEFLADNNPGVDPDELDQLEVNGEIIEGDNQDFLALVDFLNNNTLSIVGNYSIVENQIDIDNFIDYYAAQIYFANTDWPGNNLKFWRPHTADGKWKWILYDTDFGFILFNGWGSTLYHNTLLFALEPNGPHWPNPPWSTLLFRRLMENQGFQIKFLNHFCYYLNTRFDPEYVGNHIDNVIENIAYEMPNHINRWGGSMLQWSQNIPPVQEFGEERTEIVFNHLGNYFGINSTSNLTVFSLPVLAGNTFTSNQLIPQNPWVAKYFDGIPIEITAIPNPGFIFSHWEGVDSLDETITITLNGNQDITAVFVEDTNPPIILINEFLADNETIIQDEAGDYEDWVELYYDVSIPLNLEGYSLTDDFSEPNQWIFPSIEISGIGYLLIWTDNDDEEVDLHTNFKLSAGGEDIALFDPFENLVDGITFDQQVEDVSYGRVNDGINEWQFFDIPTPGLSNESSDTCSMGDVNCDGLINVVDIVQLVSFILGTSTLDELQQARVDLNSDGIINVIDIVQLVSIILYNEL